MKGVLQTLPVVGPRFQEISPAKVRAFWDYMLARYGSTLARKESSVLMQAAAKALHRMGILDQAKFLRRYTTTVGKYIFAPFVPGEPTSGYDLWHQIEICVHEHVHVVQHERAPGKFQILYISDNAKRATYEVEAYRTELELQFWRCGKIDRGAPKRLAKKLYDYGCRKADVEYAERSLAISATAIRDGAILSDITKAAIDWLDENVPYLRGHSTYGVHVPAQRRLGAGPDVL